MKGSTRSSTGRPGSASNESLRRRGDGGVIPSRRTWATGRKWSSRHRYYLGSTNLTAMTRTSNLIPRSYSTPSYFLLGCNAIIGDRKRIGRGLTSSSGRNNPSRNSRTAYGRWTCTSARTARPPGINIGNGTSRATSISGNASSHSSARNWSPPNGPFRLGGAKRGPKGIGADALTRGQRSRTKIRNPWCGYGITGSARQSRRTSGSGSTGRTRNGATRLYRWGTRPTLRDGSTSNRRRVTRWAPCRRPGKTATAAPAWPCRRPNRSNGYGRATRKSRKARRTRTGDPATKGRYSGDGRESGTISLTPPHVTRLCLRHRI